MPFEKLRVRVTNILKSENQSTNDKLSMVCHLLRESVDYYDWVGFYFKNGEKEELKLHSFAGEETDHVIIPFGKGICGQVAVSDKNFVVPDVQAQDNYIACSLSVKSEIVIPLFKGGQNIGQIDIDSNAADPFTEKDERFLEFVNQEVAKIL
ncbi:GAF domain-containing protein [Aquimarina pacifica]|uniref:GAF domain-containing protein n=1 Tax=Aquimarina pacifica TaxID=1296415 RepID=UPI00046FD0E7|nr:GAF domain-containing protein [Aquimarina pacifica]